MEVEKKREYFSKSKGQLFEQNAMLCACINGMELKVLHTPAPIYIGIGKPAANSIPFLENPSSKTGSSYKNQILLGFFSSRRSSEERLRSEQFLWGKQFLTASAGPVRCPASISHMLKTFLMNNTTRRYLKHIIKYNTISKRFASRI